MPPSARINPEWIGSHPDADIPNRVRVRVWTAAQGHCEACGRKIMAGERWEADHTIALINGGEHRESNLRCVCPWCHKAKTRADVAEKSTVYRKKAKHVLPRKPSRAFPGSRLSKFKIKMDRTVVRRGSNA
jgi:5-methylcytosine-specific restriction protein A